MEQGYTLQTHDDVPKEILYAEVQQRNKRHEIPAGGSASYLPPIHMNSVLLTQPHQASVHSAYI